MFTAPFSAPARRPRIKFATNFGDQTFKIVLSNGGRSRTKDYVLRVPKLTKYIALTALDVQCRIADVTVKPGRNFLRHVHPRSAEVIFVVRGSLLVRFGFEGLSPRNVENLIQPGQFVIIPQELIHDAVCKGKKECPFLAFFKLADPGIVVIE